MSDLETTLYDSIGGEAGIKNIVDSFYQRVLDDPELNPFFKHSSMDNLRHMQREFVAMALGGPVIYTGKPIAHVHHGRGIGKKHFTKFVQHFLDTLREMGVDEKEIYQVISRLNVYANEVMGESY